MLFDCHRCGKVVDSSEVRCIQGAVSGFYRHLECGGLAIERDDRLSALEMMGDKQCTDDDKEVAYDKS